MPPAAKKPELTDPIAPSTLLASDIRALRRVRGVTLAKMAVRLGRSIGWVSQVERGLSQPSIEDLRRIADVFGVPLSMFFGHEAANESEGGVIVRADRRRALGSSETGLTEELLSPDLGGSFELIRSEFAAGAAMAVEAQRETEDAGYVVSGRLDLEIGGVWHSLGAGDSFRFSNKTYRWRNPGDVPAVVIWVVSPPVY
jgi:transcriptional regulator with XRE-family HTH domain